MENNLLIAIYEELLKQELLTEEEYQRLLRNLQVEEKGR